MKTAQEVLAGHGRIEVAVAIVEGEGRMAAVGLPRKNELRGQLLLGKKPRATGFIPNRSRRPALGPELIVVASGSRTLRIANAGRVLGGKPGAARRVVARQEQDSVAGVALS